MGEAWLLIAACVGAWIAHSLWFPWTSCHRCAGGKIRAESGRVWRDCRACGGSGKRRRLLVRLLRVGVRS